MVSQNLEDFEVLSILGSTLQSTCYKVKCKKTSEVLVWKAVNLEKLGGVEKVEAVKMANENAVNEVNFVQLHPPILHENTNMLYIISEYYENSLQTVIRKCKKNRCVDESFLWYLIYTIIKVLNKIPTTDICIKTTKVFVDCDFNIKLFKNTQITKLQQLKSPLKDLGVILHQLCTLKTNFDYATAITDTYSEQLRNIIDMLITNNNYSIDLINKIKCHPTILTSGQYTKNSVYCVIDKSSTSNKACLDNIKNDESETGMQATTENFNNKLATLRNLEERLKEKERELKYREKKVALQERIVKEKLQRAELYVRRCKDTKSNKKSYDKRLDSSFSADCGDSSILPTSKKLNPDVIKPLQKTFSERRVTFKGHSPLRTIHYTNNVCFNRYDKANDSKKKEKECQKTLKFDKDVENYKENYTNKKSCRKSLGNQTEFENCQIDNFEKFHIGGDNCQKSFRRPKHHTNECIGDFNSKEWVKDKENCNIKHKSYKDDIHINYNQTETIKSGFLSKEQLSKSTKENKCKSIDDNMPVLDKENYLTTFKSDKSSSDSNSQFSERRILGLFRSKKSKRNPVFRNSVASVESGSVEYENDVLVKPIEWPEETKKHAFQLLRMLNSAEDVFSPLDGEVKHTYL